MNIESTRSISSIRYAVALSAAVLSGCGSGSSSSETELLSTAQFKAPVRSCNIDSLQSAAPDAVLTSAALVNAPNNGPRYCRVEGYVTTQGPAPTSNRVRFMVALPQSFKSRYYFVGEGGSAGYIPDPSEKLLAEGYAVAGADAGSPTPGVDWRFAFDRTKALDYAQRGVHVSATATQALTKAYYNLTSVNGRKMYRYIDGCSGGGRMGMVAASWYPEDFDGVIAGAPGINVNNPIFFGKIAKHLIDHPDSWISLEQLQKLEDALLQKFDGTDGVVDGLISDPSKVSLDASMYAMFTPSQQQVLRILVDGMNDFGQVYPGLTLGNPIGWSAFILGTTPPPWSMNPADNRLPPFGYLVFDTQSRGLYGPTYDFTTQFSFANSEDVNGWNAKYEEVFVGSGTVKAENLSKFLQRGGKILFWHGAADNAISMTDNLRLYRDLANQQGGQANLSQKAQMYVAPGVLHCGGGIGPQDVPEQALSAIARWVEAGVAPTQLIANRPASSTLPARSFLLCPHPQRAVYRGGNADINNAANWSCRAS